MADLSVRQLRYFLAVAQDLHFTAAAERLHLAQPALSKSIRRMERTLGLQLFDRTPRGVTLTDAGRALRPAAQDAVDRLDAGLQAARIAGRATDRILHLGYQASVGSALLRPIVDRFHRHRPGILVQPRVVDWSDPAKSVQEGSNEVALLRLPVPGAAGLDVEVIRRDRRCVALPSSHPLAQRASVQLAELQDEPFVALPLSAGPLREFWLALDQFDHPPTIAAQAANAEDWLETISSGIGIGMLAETTTHSYGRPDIAFVPVEGVPDSELAVVWRRSSTDPVVRDFVRACLESSASSG